MRVEERLLTPNQYSRPRIPLKQVRYLVIHWVANPGTTALANRNYFESLKIKKRYASAHYIIGLQGEVVRCIPETEVAYHAKEANSTSLGIENCHPDWEGKFNPRTYESLIELCSQLCIKYQLNPMNCLIRHYDITGKKCPKYYVVHKTAWEQFKRSVEKRIIMKQQDIELMQAVSGMNAYGIILNPSVWGSIKTMHMKYAGVMVERIGKKFGKNTYESTIEFLVSKQCISNRAIWMQRQFKPEWCRALIIKVYERLIKS